MNSIKLTFLISIMAISSMAFYKKIDTKVYELRVYHCHPGRLDALIARFQNHTTKIFENHGMENIAYWLPTDADKKTICIIF